jgi:mono/diheme cytochrome c family protein
MAHDHEPNSGAHGQPEPREFNSPLLYSIGLLVAVATLAWLFFHFKEVGKAHVRGEARLTAPTKGGGEPDHAALSADISQAVLDRGATIYGKQCSSCHGPQGEPAQRIYRNFKVDPFTNPNGAGPYAMYLVLTKGYGNGMPAFINISPEDRYAVGHFISETFMKGHNPSYTQVDSPEVKKLIPPPGAGAAAVKASGPEFVRDPRSIEGPGTLLPLLAADARRGEVATALVSSWIARASTGSPAEVSAPFDRLAILAKQHPGQIASLLQIVRSGNRNAFGDFLSNQSDPVLSLMSKAKVNTLFDRLAAVSSTSVAEGVL